MSDLVPASAALAVPASAATLPPDVLEAVLAGIPDSTRRAYRSDWQRFTRWCAEAGETPLPASAATLAAYEKYLAYDWIAARAAVKPGAEGAPRGMSPASVIRSRAAIIKIHKLAGSPPPATELAIGVMRGYTAHLASTRDPRAQPRKATAARLEDLAAITAAPAPTGLATIRDRAMLLLSGSAIGARASELVFLNIEDVTELPAGLSVSVYRSKTRTRDEVAVQGRHAPQTVMAVTEWLAALRAAGRTRGPLFVQVNRKGRIQARQRAGGGPLGDPEGRLAAQAVTRILRGHATAAAVPGRWSAHSLRRGLATNARAAGHDRIAIARQGGWAPDSTALAGYMDDADKWGDDNALRGAAL